MDHRSISSTIDSAFTFSDGGPAVNDMSSCSFVSVWCVIRSLRKFAVYVSNVSVFISFLSFYLCLSLHEVSNCFLLYTTYKYILLDTPL